MNDLMIFNNDEFGQVRTVEVDEKIYFVASDVAKALGYKNDRDAINRHCRWVVKHDIPHPQSKTKTIEINIIPEGDLYRLVAGSELPNAQKFESWIFDEVIPSIRKNGGYIVGQENLLDGISPELRAVIVVDKRVTAVENKVSHLENTMNIDYSQQRQLKNLAKEVVVNALGGNESKAYRHRNENGEKISAKCFSRFWHDFNDYFDINAYANLPRVRFDEAVEYINKWQLPINMQLEIEKINGSD